MTAELLEKIRTLPRCPGCYLFFNAEGQIIYVGKSKSLRDRVKQYFQGNTRTEKVVQLAWEATDVEIRPAETELDALLMEYRLIKTHMPRYNVQHKRSRRACYIHIQAANPYPMLHTVAERGAPGAYIGPFANLMSAQEMLHMIGAVWKTPTCDRERLPGSACLEHGMRRCSAPCIGGIGEAAYQRRIREIRGFFQGRDAQVLNRLRRKMQSCARALRYEEAAELRNEIRALEQLIRRNRRVNIPFEGQDVCAFIRAYREPQAHLFFIRDGVALRRTILALTTEPDECALAEFVNEARSAAQALPDGEWIARGIRGVLADKFFVPAGRLRTDRLAELLAEAYIEFQTPWVSALASARVAAAPSPNQGR